MAFLDRAKVVDLGRLKVPMITPEDLVIAKLFASRPRDLEDIHAVVGTLGGSMELRCVRNLLGQLDEAEDRAELLGRHRAERVRLHTEASRRDRDNVDQELGDGPPRNQPEWVQSGVRLRERCRCRSRDGLDPQLQ